MTAKNTKRENYFDYVKEIDAQTGIEVLGTFEKFSQRDDVFCRALWDDEVSSQKVKDFYKTKLVTAQFYFQRILPRADAHAKAASAGATSVMNLEEDSFAF